MQIQSPNATGRPRVAAIVLNSVNHDARVLKEADSLAKAGFDVHILGIQDKRCDDALTQRSSHVTIHRIALQANLILHRLRARKRVLMMGIVAMLFLSIGILVSPLRNFLKGFDSDL
ncbi:MAG: hypothetical protein GY895_15540 [Phycisphaera sp.]|nr:hypothetical protein [Phycisphaera sp.]